MCWPRARPSACSGAEPGRPPPEGPAHGHQRLRPELLAPRQRIGGAQCEKLANDILEALRGLKATTAHERAADHDIRPGVSSDEGEGDAWPALRRRILAADIFVLTLPIWLGQPSSTAKRALERMDAFLSETDGRQRMPAFGKVAIVGVAGNEDGAHHCHAACFQALNDVGFSIAPNAGVYWVGEAMGDVNYIDLPRIPEKVAAAIGMAASNAHHLAKLLKASPLPGV